MSDSRSEDWTRDFVAEASEALGSDDVGVEGDELVCRFVVQRGMSSWKQSEPVTVRVSLGAPSEWGADENVTPGELSRFSGANLTIEEISVNMKNRRALCKTP